MEKITKARQGLDINLDFTIMRGVLPEDLVDADNIKVKLVRLTYSNVSLPNKFKVVNNRLKIQVKGEDQSHIGPYRLEVSYTKHNPDRDPNNEPFVVDAMAFEIVAYSNMVDLNGECPNLSVTQIELTGVIDISKTSGGGAGGGTNGATFTPSATVEGSTITFGWDNDKGLANPINVQLTVPKGEPFTYADFTPAQLEKLKGSNGDDFKYSDFTPAQLAELKGAKGDAFVYSDFTEGQLSQLKGDAFIYENFTAEQLAVLKGADGVSGKMKNTISTETIPTLTAETDNTYEYNELTSLQISFTTPTELTTVNRFVVKFISGSTATTVTLQQPDNIIKDVDFEIKANQYYTLDFEYAWGKWVLFSQPIARVL